ncbi:unnamed protein product [Pylaiella littoralis]
MPFFLKPEAGSGVSELLDDRLENLKLELKASEKTCQALLPNVEAFTKGSREMCRGAGKAASAFGAALQVDLARTGAAENTQHSAARVGHKDNDGDGPETTEGTELRRGEEADATRVEKAAAMGGVVSGETMRAELLALQLIECANEMEDHLRAQVVQPIERVLASRSDIKAAIRERSLAADDLAAAHSEYAKSVARYQSSSGDNVNGGPPLEVVISGDSVVKASDAFAEAHGRAEEALTELLEERGRCLREAASSLKAAQAGFFVRASRCVSSSVVWESTNDVLSRASGYQKQSARSSIDDASTTPPASDEVSSAAVGTEGDHKGGTGDVAGGQTRSTLYAAGVDDRGNVKGKWRKGGDRDLMRGDSSKRRRSSGWFKRLASSFQTNQASSASEELREGVPSLLHGALPSLLHGAAEHDDSGGDNGNERWISSTAPAMMSSATISSGRPQSEGDGVRNEDGGQNGDAPTPKDRGADFGTVGTSSLTDAGFLEFVAESARRAAREKREGGDVVTRAGNNGAEAQAEMEGETSDYETGSGTTEGFGSDDAGDLWEGERRSTLLEPLGRTSFMPNDDGMRGEIEMKDNVSGIGASGEGNSGKVASTANAAGGQADGGETMPGTQAGEVEALGVEALIEEGAKTESRVTVPALDVDSFVTATKAAEAESSPNSTGGAEHGDSDDHADRESNVGQGERGLNDYSSAPPSCAEGAKVADISTPVAKPRLSHFGNVSPSRAPPSVLPATLPETVKKEDGKEEDPLPPVAVEEHTPSPFAKFGSSPAISDGNSPKESPRAWRLSWWARASERHPPSAPVGNGGNEEADGGTGTSFAAALNAAAGGEEAVAAALSAGGAFAPSCHAGDAPAVVDSGDKMTSAEKTDGSAVAAVAAGVDVAKRARRRSMRRRREKPWLSKDQLTDTQVRPLEAASEYLDVAGLARSGAVCRAWRRPLSGEEGRRRWMRCVRLPEGVPDMWRAKFYLHILYDQPSWVQQAHGSTSTERPRPGVYQGCLAKARDDQEETRAAKEMRSISEGERNGRTSPLEIAKYNPFEDTGAPLGTTGTSTDEYGTSTPTPKCHKWLEEIETDVLRTCPGDKTTGEDAIDEFDDAISQQSSTAAERDDDRGNKLNSTPGVGSTRVRFSLTSSRSGSSGAVVEGSGMAPPTGVILGEDLDGANGQRKLTSTGGGTRDKLRRVLRAFAVYNRRVSYCQGMNFVALALLEACGGNDEDAFWILAGMCENLELEGLWCQGLERLDLCFFSLERLLRRHCPSLRQHLSDEGVELSMFTSRWFVTLFTSTDVFGRGTSRKILDMFLVEGWPLLFKMSLGVLLEMRPLLEPADMEGILKVTKFPRAHLFGLRRDGSGRHIAGASFEEATQGSLCESIRAGQMVEHALMLHISEETLEQHRQQYRVQKHAEPGSD